jgi:hypothetical protein
MSVTVPIAVVHHPAMLGPGLVGGFGDDRVDQEQHLDVVRITARRGRPGADVVAVRLHAAIAIRRGDDAVGGAGGELPAPWRAAGLHEGGPALGRGHRVQRAAAFEEAALEVDRLDLGMVGEGAGGAVHHHRVRTPGVE